MTMTLPIREYGLHIHRTSVVIPAFQNHFFCSLCRPSINIMPLSVQLTVVPKDRQPSVQQETVTGQDDPSMFSPTKQRKKTKDRSSEGQGFSDEPAKASPRQPDEEDELEAEEGYHPHEEGGVEEEVEEMDLKDLEISRPSRKKGLNHSYASSHSGGSSSASLNYKL